MKEVPYYMLVIHYYLSIVDIPQVSIKRDGKSLSVFFIKICKFLNLYILSLILDRWLVGM